MVHIRYSRWDATLRDSFDSESVFDQLNEYMNDTGDLQQAMRRLMQKGIEQGEKQSKGIDELLAQVAREMRKLYDEYRLQSAMDEVQQQLESIVDQEHRTLEELDQAGQDTQSKQQFLNDLPGKVSEAVEKLTAYRFENSDAEREFQQLVLQLEQIRKLENWLRREGSLFRGQTPMQFQQSQELMERMEELRRLEGQLSSMQLRDVDKELLEKLLGGDPKQDFEGVMRMQSLLEEGGYVLEQGDRFELTPRGVRRVGQLALRDIYQQLRRDGMGRHSTRHQGSQEFLTENSRPYVQGDPVHMRVAAGGSFGLVYRPGYRSLMARDGGGWVPGGVNWLRVRAGGKTIVVDTALGEKQDDKQKKCWSLIRPHGELLDGLARLGE